MLVNWVDKRVLTIKQIMHSLTFKIKDVEFFPNSIRKFVTSGVQHMMFWRLNGRNLESNIGELSIPKAFSNQGNTISAHVSRQQGKFGLGLVCEEISSNQNEAFQKDEDLDSVFVTFLCVKFLKNTLITSGDDGFLYLWEDERIKRRAHAHDGAVLCLNVNEKYGLIASGASDGTVVLWRLTVEEKSSAKSLDKLVFYNVAKNID